jgi:hypothetical protein
MSRYRGRVRVRRCVSGWDTGNGSLSRGDLTGKEGAISHAGASWKGTIATALHHRVESRPEACRPETRSPGRGEENFPSASRNWPPMGLARHTGINCLSNVLGLSRLPAAMAERKDAITPGISVWPYGA